MKSSSPMHHENARGIRLRYCAFAFIVAVFSAAYFAPVPNLMASPQLQAVPAQKAQAPEADQEEARQALSIAEAQHERVLILISQGKYDRVFPEVKTILDLKLPDKYETNVAKSACIIANGLAESKQFTLAHAVLDEALRRMKQVEDKVSILKVKAFVYKG